MPPDPLQLSRLPRSFAPTTHELAVPIQKMLRGPWTGIMFIVAICSKFALKTLSVNVKRIQSYHLSSPPIKYMFNTPLQSNQVKRFAQ